MADSHIATYLNDHLAGSVAALSLLEDMIAAQGAAPAAVALQGLRADIELDRDELQALMARLQVSESSTRKAAAWLVEKAAELKMGLDDPTDGSLRLLESLEALALGLEGKRALWQALAAVGDQLPGLQQGDYDRLTRRAEDQRARVEALRLEAARSALVAGS